MPIRTNGGVFSDQMLTGSLVHYVICGADFSGAINSFGMPVPFSAAEIIFNRIESGAYINIMNPNTCNISFALERDRSIWNEVSLTAMVQSLGTDVGVDHIDCSVCTVREVPYIWDCDAGASTFLDLTDTPSTYAGSAGYVVTVNPGETGLIFTPAGSASNAFSFVEVPTEPTLSASTSSTLTILPGPNITLATDALLNTLTITSTAGADYIPIPPGTALDFSLRYFVTAPGTVTLPIGTGSGQPAGTSVTVAKPTFTTVLINALGGDDISTDLGNDTSVEFDATQECIFIFDGISTWNLQIGSVN